MRDDFAAGRDAPQLEENQAAQRIEFIFFFLGNEVEAEFLFQLVDADAGVDFEQMVIDANDFIFRLFVFIVLILDIADDLLEQIFHRHQPVRAAIFIDDNGDVASGMAHAHQQIDNSHRRRHEQHLAHHRMRVERLVARQHRQQILHMDKALHLVERILVDGNAGVALLDDVAHQFRQLDIAIDGGDVGARHHDVADFDVAEGQHVMQHDFFFRLQPLLGLAFMLLDGFFDRFLERGVLPVAKRMAQPAAHRLQQRRVRCGIGFAIGSGVGCGA